MCFNCVVVTCNVLRVVKCAVLFVVNSVVLRVVNLLFYVFVLFYVF